MRNTECGMRNAELGMCLEFRIFVRNENWMEINALKNRFKICALEIVRFAEQLPEKPSYKMVRGQIIRSGPSSAANYRAACRRKSARDFIAKMGIVEEELDETMFWLEFTVALSDSW